MSLSKSADVTDFLNSSSAVLAISRENDGDTSSQWAAMPEGKGGPEKGMTASTATVQGVSAITMTETRARIGIEEMCNE